MNLLAQSYPCQKYLQGLHQTAKSTTHKNNDKIAIISAGISNIDIYNQIIAEIIMKSNCEKAESEGVRRKLPKAVEKTMNLMATS